MSELLAEPSIEKTPAQFSQIFTAQFQAIRSELDSKLEIVKTNTSPSQDDIQALSLLLVKATKALVDATGSIPTYDQKQFENQLKILEKAIEELRKAAAPKTKFSFKRKDTPREISIPASKPGASVIAGTTLQTSINPSDITLCSQSQKYLTRASLPQHSYQTDLSLFDLDNCFVDLLSSGVTEPSGALIISALHARNLTNCVLLLSEIEGSALLHDLFNCVIILGCHQFRMHSSNHVDVFLSITSNPVIEHCNGIRFAQFPNSVQSFLRNYKGPSPLYVQDFSHIRPTISPHFSFLKEEDIGRIDNWLVSTRSDVERINLFREYCPNNNTTYAL